MNERIKELAEQAGIITEVWKTDSLGHGYKVPNYEAKKFAELIVEECARVAFATAIGDGTPDEIYDAIKETFRS
jgi:hypothetical protein